MEACSYMNFKLLLHKFSALIKLVIWYGSSVIARTRSQISKGSECSVPNQHIRKSHISKYEAFHYGYLLFVKLSFTLVVLLYRFTD